MSEVNTLFPYRDGFVLADPTAGHHPTHVVAIAADVSGTAIEQAHAVIAHAKAQFEKHLDGIQRDRYSAEGLREEIAQFADTAAARAVDKAVELVRQRRDEAQTQAGEVRRNLSPGGDTAAELRATRYWNRTKAVLDVSDSGQLLPTAQDLIAEADRLELGTLLQELPSYVQARGFSTEWVDSAVAQVVPEFDRAREQLTKSEQALQITSYNADALRRSLSEGRPTTKLVDPGKYDPDDIH